MSKEAEDRARTEGVRMEEVNFTLAKDKLDLVITPLEDVVRRLDKSKVYTDIADDLMEISRTLRRDGITALCVVQSNRSEEEVIFEAAVDSETARALKATIIDPAQNAIIVEAPEADVTRYVYPTLANNLYLEIIGPKEREGVSSVCLIAKKREIVANRLLYSSSS